MKKPLVVLVAVLVTIGLNGSASARWEADAKPVLPHSGSVGSSLDLRSGNAYDWITGADGTTYLRGSNSDNGTDWQTLIQPNGDKSGLDELGDFWTYSKGSGLYHNFDTGEICIGWVCK